MTAIARTTGAEIAGIPLEITEAGHGRPLLFLHGGHPSGRLDPQARLVEALADNFRFIAPTHPGFGITAAPPQLAMQLFRDIKNGLLRTARTKHA